MNDCKISLNTKEIVRVSTEEGLVKFLNSVFEGFVPPNPLFEMIHTGTGNFLFIGISQEGCYVSYLDSSLDPPCFSSRGSQNDVSQDEIVKFQMSETNHVTEVWKWETISFDDLASVAITFFASGLRPESIINWKED